MSTLAEEFGQIDIYLFDQMLRGRIRPGMRVLDAGCGDGRNLIYLLRNGYDVYGSDWNAHAVNLLRRRAATLAPHIAESNFHVEDLETMSFPDAFADVVISSAVLHFANNTRHFNSLLHNSWRVLKHGGLFFCRLASSIGMSESNLINLDGGRIFRLPDGSDRYLVNEEILMKATVELGGELIDPIKTTVVQNERCMTTWVLRKQR